MTAQAARKATGSTRRAMLRQSAGTLRDAGLTGDALLTALESINEKDCIPPLEDDVVKDIAAQADRETRHLSRQSLAAWRFVERMADVVRYDNGRRRWLLWQGHRWRPDDDAGIKRLWLDVLGQRWLEALKLDDERRKRATDAIQAAGATDAAVASGIALASAMKPVAMSGNEFDLDPWLLGCENGVVDLRTGELRDGRPEDLITMSTGLSFDPAATCPRWDRYLLEVFAQDEELAIWYQLLIGASLIGMSKEAVAIYWGSGNNGKSKAYETLLLVFGDYGVQIGIETVTNARRTAGAPSSDLMRLRGARLALAAEPDEGARLKGGTLKNLASIDKMTGRELHGRQAEWEPTHTLHIATNHLPDIRDSSEGMWRRLLLVPFNVSFYKDRDPKEDPRLGEALAREAPGVLAWAVRGAVAYEARRSLHPVPGSVSAATSEYRRSEDTLQAFVEDRLEQAGDGRVRGPDLYQAYCSWADELELRPVDRYNNKQFGKEWKNRYPHLGYRVTRSQKDGVWVYFGLRIKGS